MTTRGSRRDLLRLSLIAPAVALPIALAPAARANDHRPALDRAIDAFFAGWRTGNWQPYLDLCARDVTFQFPVGPQGGRHTGTDGRAALEAWCASHAAADRITDTVESLRMYDGEWAVVCDRGTGVVGGQSYTGLHAIFMRARSDGLIVEFREYFGELGG
jgi:ketosteroid isomerase-like protein